MGGMYWGPRSLMEDAEPSDEEKRRRLLAARAIESDTGFGGDTDKYLAGYEGGLGYGPDATLEGFTADRVPMPIIGNRVTIEDAMPDFSDVRGGSSGAGGGVGRGKAIKAPIGGDGSFGSSGSASGNAIEGNRLDWSVPGFRSDADKPWFTPDASSRAADEEAGRALASRYGARVNPASPPAAPAPTMPKPLPPAKLATAVPPPPVTKPSAPTQPAIQPPAQSRTRLIPNTSISATEDDRGRTIYTNRLGPDALFGPEGSVDGSRIAVADPTSHFKGKGDIRADEYAGLRSHAFGGGRTAQPKALPYMSPKPLFDERGNRLERYADVGGGRDIEGRLRAEAELAAPALQESQIKAELSRNQRSIEDPYGLNQRRAEAGIEADKQIAIEGARAKAAEQTEEQRRTGFARESRRIEDAAAKRIEEIKAQKKDADGNDLSEKDRQEAIARVLAAAEDAQRRTREAYGVGARLTTSEFYK